MQLLPLNSSQTHPKPLYIGTATLDAYDARFARHHEPAQVELARSIHHFAPLFQTKYVMTVDEHSRELIDRIRTGRRQLVARHGAVGRVVRGRVQVAAHVLFDPFDDVCNGTVEEMRVLDELGQVVREVFV